MNKDDAKDVEFYAALVNAWLKTKFERDKSLLNISACAIGLLIISISTIEVKSADSLIFYVFALISFSLCLILCIAIFNVNAKYLESLLNKNNENYYKLLLNLDRIVNISFISGVFFTLCFALLIY